jgi:thiol-disulfide isomerase/thioredoxin
MRRTWIATALALSVFATTARADATLDIAGWLARPGVKAVAVEFYATWCKPCMEAMPRWKRLQELYGHDGLKVIVVNTRDASGGCANLGWKPDDVVCDIDGLYSERLGVQDLPAAFVWSWQGNLLVQGGHIGEVEAAVEREMRSVPHVEVRANAGVPATVVTALRNRLTDSGKVVLIADEKERDELARIRLAQQKPSVDPDKRCELGKELPGSSRALLNKEVAVFPPDQDDRACKGREKTADEQGTQDEEEAPTREAAEVDRCPDGTVRVGRRPRT